MKGGAGDEMREWEVSYLGLSYEFFVDCFGLVASGLPLGLSTLSVFVRMCKIFKMYGALYGVLYCEKLLNFVFLIITYYPNHTSCLLTKH